jgi:hypothetical protein
MLRKLLVIALLISFRATAQVDSADVDNDDLEHPAAQPTDKQANSMYRMKYAIDLPIIGVGGGWTMYAFTKIYSKSKTPLNEILASIATISLLSIAG